MDFRLGLHFVDFAIQREVATTVALSSFAAALTATLKTSRANAELAIAWLIRATALTTN